MEVIVNECIPFKEVKIGEIFDQCNGIFLKTEPFYSNGDKYNAISIEDGETFLFFSDDDPIDKIFRRLILE